MVQVPTEQIEKYVQVIREVHCTHTTYDVHIHPFEFFFDSLEYQENPDRKGLFSLSNAKYSPPTLEALKASLGEEKKGSSNTPDSRTLRFFLRKRYSHTGPLVFRALFDIAGIDKGLVLPVPRGNSTYEEQMDLAFRMFLNDERFCLAGCIPNSVGNEGIQTHLKTQIDKYAIVAVKIHPNLTGIDLRGTAGRERIGYIFDACSILNLPVIIHVGRSAYLSEESDKFAQIDNFRQINLKASVPIVMAHGGAYGLHPSEISERVIPVLKELLDTNENLCIDMAGLPFESVLQLLLSIDIGRIIFGSDALYYDPFATGIRLLTALEAAHLKIEEAYMKIISENIEKRAFKWK